MIGSQTGTAVGELAREVVGSSDIGLPLGPEGVAALLPAGVAAVRPGPVGRRRRGPALPGPARGRPPAAVRARPVAARAPARRGRAVRQRHHGRHGAAAGGDPGRRHHQPRGAARRAGGRGPVPAGGHPAQKAALVRLETALALVEGWVATVVSAAARDRLTHADALAEAIRRRRATGGPAERTFATLVGLELRPRRLREAAAIWQGLTEARGIEAGTPCGPILTCCRPPTTWRTRIRSCTASPNWTSRTEDGDDLPGG